MGEPWGSGGAGTCICSTPKHIKHKGSVDGLVSALTISSVPFPALLASTTTRRPPPPPRPLSGVTLTSEESKASNSEDGDAGGSATVCGGGADDGEEEDEDEVSSSIPLSSDCPAYLTSPLVWRRCPLGRRWWGRRRSQARIR